ncbi:sensor histidine kinase [Bradyrhizobium sp.]
MELQGPLILATASVIVLQSALIVALLFHVLRRRRVERSLKESEQRWSSMFELFTAGIALMDQNLRFVATNTSFQSMLGFRAEELRELSLLDISIDGDQGTSRELFDELRSGQQQRRDLVGQYRCKDKTPIWTHLYISTIGEKESKPMQFLATMIDITAEKQAEDATLSAHSELMRVARLSMIGEMTASIAHEINQPLGAIVVNGEAGLRWLARSTPDLDEARDALKRIVNDGHRAGQVMASVRSLFRKQYQPKEPDDINEILREVLALVGRDTEKRQIVVLTELSGELPYVLLDRVQMMQVFLNLFTNAIDAVAGISDRAKVLRLNSELHGSNEVLITVEDSGVGFDENVIGHLFEPFATTKPQGMGMGLSICRSIVEGHGGTISASRGDPHGAVFQVVLPGCERSPEA